MQPAAKKHPRVLTFDLMRGYFLVAIIIDHLRFFPNGLDWMSAQGGLFVTAAEGFFLISGIVLGIVRGAKLIDEPFKKVAKLLLKRGVQLYLTVVVLIIIFTLVGWAFYMNNPGLKPGILPAGSFGDLIFGALSLQYFYGWADYLRLYAVFLFVSPLLMWLLRRGKWYIVLLMSLAVWALFPSDPSVDPMLQEKYQMLSWQLLFFGGMIVGFYWPKLTGWWKGMARKYQLSILIPLLTVAVVTLVYNILIMLSTQGFNVSATGASPQLQHDLYVAFFDKERMPLTRVGLFLIWFWAAFYLFHKLEKPIKKWFGWLLESFGTNSLYVYTLHAFAIFFVHLYFTSGPLWFNFLVTISILLTIKVMIHYRVLMKVIPR